MQESLFPQKKKGKIREQEFRKGKLWEKEKVSGEKTTKGTGLIITYRKSPFSIEERGERIGKELFILKGGESVSKEFYGKSSRRGGG